jgi:hypothetical protein
MISWTAIRRDQIEPAAAAGNIRQAPIKPPRQTERLCETDP